MDQSLYATISTCQVPIAAFLICCELKKKISQDFKPLRASDFLIIPMLNMWSSSASFCWWTTIGLIDSGRRDLKKAFVSFSHNSWSSWTRFGSFLDLLPVLFYYTANGGIAQVKFINNSGWCTIRIHGHAAFPS